MPINTHDAFIDFGKYKGQRITRLPVSYLKFAITEGIRRPIKTLDGDFPFVDVARAEIERRGERLETIDVSHHAIDRLSLHCLDLWKHAHSPGEGIAAWAQRMALEAWAKRTEPAEGEDNIKVDHNGLRWVFEEMAIPVLKTVLRRRSGRAQRAELLANSTALEPEGVPAGQQLDQNDADDFSE